MYFLIIGFGEKNRSKSVNSAFVSNINVPVSLYRQLLPVCVPDSASRVLERYNVHFFFLCSSPLTGIALVWFASSCTVRGFHYESELRGTGNHWRGCCCCVTQRQGVIHETNTTAASRRLGGTVYLLSISRHAPSRQIIKDLLNRRLHREENSRVPIASWSALYLFSAF